MILALRNDESTCSEEIQRIVEKQQRYRSALTTKCTEVLGSFNLPSIDCASLFRRVAVDLDKLRAGGSIMNSAVGKRTAAPSVRPRTASSFGVARCAAR